MNRAEAPELPPLSPGDAVRTPSGSIAEVIAHNADVDEALVQWSSGDRARFRISHLRRMRRPEAA
jgi:hypothetical protein